MSRLIVVRHCRLELRSALALMVGTFLGACGVQAHPTAGSGIVAVSGGAGLNGSAGAAGTTGAAGTSAGAGTAGTYGRGGTSGSAGTYGTPGIAGSGVVTGVAGRGGTTGTGEGGSGMGGTGATGAGVTINGKFVPKEKAVVIIHIGHSNMRGQATKPTSVRPYFFDTQDGLWSYKGSFTLAKEPTAPEGSMPYAGPGMAILHSAQTALQAGSDVQLISVAYGKGSVTSVDFQKSTNTYYPIFMNWAQQLKGNVTFAGVVIMLGITERHLPTAQIPSYPSRIAQLVSDIRADLGEPNLPALFCDYEQQSTGELAPTGSVGLVVQPLTRMLPSVVSKLVLVPTDGIQMQDDHHFDMQGHKDWSDRVIMLMKSNGWWRW